MAKIHYRNDEITKDVPRHIMDEYKAKGERGALCGYVRPRTTTDKDKVTCFYCKRLLAHG